MKRFALAVVVMGSMVLSACGNAEKEKELQGKVDACMKDAADKTTRIAVLESELAALKAAAAPVATPEPVATSKPGAKKTPAPAKTAAPTPTPAPATPTPTPKVPTNIKLPGKLPG